MKKMYPFLSLLFILSLVACTSDTKTVDDPTGKETPVDAKAANPEELKKTDVKAYNRSTYDKIVMEMQSPESVITDGKYFYVSNVGPELAPSKKDADGFISKLDAEGNILELKWYSGDDLHAPKGMAIVKNVLYVADIDKVRGFDLKSKEKVFEVDFIRTGTIFLNDLVAVDDHTLYVSSTDLGQIFKVNLKGKGSFEMVDIYSDLGGVNGLYYDKSKNRLMIAGYGLDGSPTGMVGVCDLAKTPLKQKTIGAFHGYLDGIQQVADDMVLVTDWQDFEKGGNLIFYDLVTEELRPVMGGLIGGPADFYYDAKTKKIWLPAMKDSELIITKLDVDLVRKDQGTLINSTGGYEVRTKDTIAFPKNK